MPGILSRLIKAKFPTQVNLPVNEVPLPEAVRLGDARFRHQPHVQFLSENFIAQLGPQVVSLTTRGSYSGWTTFSAEIRWLLDKLKEADIVEEGERIGLRFIDFFEGNLFDKLDATFLFGGQNLAGPELSVTKVMKKQPFQARLALNNSATTKIAGEAKRGSVLDLDVSIGPQHFELFESGMVRLNEAHLLNKQVFFGLLKADYLETLNPIYDES